MAEPLRPARGGFLRPFGCGWFIREFLLGHGPYDSRRIDADVGAPQADIFFNYKTTLLQAIALDRATREEERRARRERRAISPENIEKLTERYLARLPYKATSCRFHSFVVYFANLQRLHWVEFTGKEEPSAFQDHYPPVPSRKYFRLTTAGRQAGDAAWSNPPPGPLRREIEELAGSAKASLCLVCPEKLLHCETAPPTIIMRI